MEYCYGLLCAAFVPVTISANIIKNMVSPLAQLRWQADYLLFVISSLVKNKEWHE